MRLYDSLESGNGYKCRLLLALLGIPFERIEFDVIQRLFPDDAACAAYLEKAR